MFDTEDVIFETNGAVTVLSPNHTAPSFLLVNNGAIIESTLAQCNLSKSWVLEILYVTDLNRQQNSFVWNGHLVRVSIL